MQSYELFWDSIRGTEGLQGSLILQNTWMPNEPSMYPFARTIGSAVRRAWDGKLGYMKWIPAASSIGHTVTAFLDGGAAW